MVVDVRGSERFLHVSLLNTGPLSTSYKEEKLKWLIRDHLLSLISEFPTLKLSIDSLSHDNGFTAKLLKATGALPCFNILVTIWIPQLYPLLPPILFLSSSSAGTPIIHPCVDPSTGLTTIPYLTMWNNKKSKLTELVRNLVRIFKFSNVSSNGHVRVSSLPSRREAIDRLAIHLLNRMAIFNGEVKEEKDKVSIIRSRLKERAILSSDMLSELNYEHVALQKKAKEREAEVEEITKWLEGCDMSKLPPKFEAEDAFQATDEASKVLLENKAAEDAIDDTVRAMDKAMGKGVIPLDVYLKQVRSLALEQFKHRSMLMEVNNEPRFALS